MGQGKYDESLPLFQRARRLVAGEVGPGRTLPHYLDGRIGECLLGLKKFEQASHHLLKAYRGVSTKYQPNTSSNYDELLVNRVDACVRLYEAWDKAEPSDKRKAAIVKWKRERDRVLVMLEPNQDISR